MSADIHAIPGYLTPDGELLRPLPTWLSHNGLVSGYEAMVLARQLDKKCIALQRTGQLGTYPSTLGQEAIGVALGQRLADSDVLVPYYRDSITQLLRGLPMTCVLQYWGGDERGSDFPTAREDFPYSVPIATQALHACGIASAFKIRGEKRVVATTCGDGATSKGDFLEAINLAGAWQLPVVFVVNNNQWAISVPRQLQCAAETLAAKALGAGIQGITVDGCDLIALHEALRLALERAHSGKGATLVEASTYRLGDHTTADDATRYRSADDLKAGWQREPIKRLQRFLYHEGLWDEAREQALLERCNQQVQQAVDDYLNMPPQPATAMFDYLYAELPYALQEQYEALRAKAARLQGESSHD